MTLAQGVKDYFDELFINTIIYYNMAIKMSGANAIKLFMAVIFALSQ
jgi:hypothetical protein